MQGYRKIQVHPLRAQGCRYSDYVQHWHLVNGYDTEDGFNIKAVTYSSYKWLDFEDYGMQGVNDWRG